MRSEPSSSRRVAIRDRLRPCGVVDPHGVSFEEAETCFDDPRACYLHNEAPSYEDRLAKRVNEHAPAGLGSCSGRVSSLGAPKLKNVELRSLQSLDAIDRPRSKLPWSV
jgi:hypothetical protein